MVMFYPYVLIRRGPLYHISKLSSSIFCVSWLFDYTRWYEVYPKELIQKVNVHNDCLSMLVAQVKPSYNHPLILIDDLQSIHTRGMVYVDY